MAEDFPQNVKFSTGKSHVVIFQEPRFGHWKIKPEKGPIPKDLDGAYTEYSFAVSAVKQYLQKTKKDLVPIEEVT